MSDVARKSKKRKSTAQDSSVQIALDESTTSSGPAFVNFPSVRPAKTTPFTLFSREIASSSDLTKQRTIIAGETEDVEFYSTNRDFQKGGEGSDCQYLPALYDPSTQTLTVHPSTPLYLMTHRVKRLITSKVVPVNDPDARGAYQQRRNNLGEAFGTRKAKTQIRAEERNRVDVGAMEGAKAHLMDSIVGKAVASGAILPSESIPTPDLDTRNPMEIYTRQALIPDEEYSAISVSAIIQAEDDRTRRQLLPWTRGRWLDTKLKSIVAGPKAELKPKLKYLYYLSCLHCFLGLAGVMSKSTPAELQQKCGGMPVQILSGLLSRFAEPNGKHYLISDKMRAKILAWICCLCLMLDDGTVETSKIAKDLSMTDAKVQVVFKSLGCSVDVASVAEREKNGITLQEAQLNKRAVLKAPVQFPKTGRRGPVKR